MAAIIPQPTGKKSKYRATHSLRIDMTPMVDLGFLLITFFIFTTTMTEGKATNLAMPKEGPPTPVADSKALTALLCGGDSVVIYNGDFRKAAAQQTIFITNYATKDGLGKYIRDKQKILGTERDHLMVQIKPMNQSSYSELMKAIDEMLINSVSRYAIVDASPQEESYVHSRLKTN